MEKYTVTFKQVDDQGFVRSTTATTKDGYFSVLGEPVTWEDIEWPKLHLVGDNLLPMHYEANLGYEWKSYSKSRCNSANWVLIIRHYLTPTTNVGLTDDDLLSQREFHNEVTQMGWYEVDRALWREFALKALDFLKEHDGEDIWVTDQPVFDEDSVWVEIEGYGKLPCTYTCAENSRVVVETGDYTFECFEDRDEAGRKAREYWEDLAEHDRSEFAEIVGTETLVAWALGNSVGPGTTKVSSLEEWFDLWLETPEEHWASYDNLELEIISISPLITEEVGELGVAYRSN